MTRDPKLKLQDGFLHQISGVIAVYLILCFINICSEIFSFYEWIPLIFVLHCSISSDLLPKLENLQWVIQHAERQDKVSERDNIALSHKIPKWAFSSQSSKHCLSQTVRARDLNFWENVDPSPCVTFLRKVHYLYIFMRKSWF